jgi:hypothetical protein
MSDMIIISPFSRPLKNGAPNAKEYPIEFWRDLVEYLELGLFDVMQIGVEGEERICEQTAFNAPPQRLLRLLENAASYIAVDNFFPHFAHYHGYHGNVLFTKSDPLLFGYRENNNIIKDREHLRPDQFGIWESCPYDQDAIMDIKDVLISLRLNSFSNSAVAKVVANNSSHMSLVHRANF